MSDLAVVGLGAGLGMGGSMMYLIAKLRKIAVEPPLSDDVKRPVRNAAFASVGGSAVLVVGSLGNHVAVAALGASTMFLGLLAVPVAGWLWRREAERERSVETQASGL